ncbi:MAG: response regulator transcription factor [Verrucomicrobia bacterium]|nr:response regulator transcription factor [Verrucomicrobiota bacterium]
MQRILVIEDDAVTARGIATGLTAEGFQVRTAGNGADGVQSLEAQSPDLVVLDWMLPQRDGLSILQWLRARGQRMPVLLLTARDAVEDRVKGLEAGADDYLSKPFAFAELLARVRALLRRANPAEPWQRTLADLTVNFETRQVVRAAQAIELTPREFDLLAYLILRAGEVVGRDQLAREVWREAHRATPLDNVIDVHIARLRRKIDEGHEAKLVQTVRGLGFMLREASVA